MVEFYILLRGGNPDIDSHILSNYYNLTRLVYYRQIEKATETGNLTEFIDYGLLALRDGLVNTLEIIQESQFENTWQKLIFDKFDAIKAGSREITFNRQRTLALELPIDKEFSVSQVASMSIKLVQFYSGKNENPFTVIWKN